MRLSIITQIGIRYVYRNTALCPITHSPSHHSTRYPSSFFTAISNPSVPWFNTFRQFLQRAQKDSCQFQVNSHDHPQQPHSHQQAKELYPSVSAIVESTRRNRTSEEK